MSPSADVTLCRCYSLPMSPSADITLRRCHSLPMSPSADVTLCRCQSLSMSSSADVTLCRCHPPPMSPSTDVTLCRCHPLPMSSSADVILCRRHPLLTSPSANVILCRCHPLPMSSSADVILCRRHPLPMSLSADITLADVPSHSPPASHYSFLEGAASIDTRCRLLGIYDRYSCLVFVVGSSFHTVVTDSLATLRATKHPHNHSRFLSQTAPALPVLQTEPTRSDGLSVESAFVRRATCRCWERQPEGSTGSRPFPGRAAFRVQPPNFPPHTRSERDDEEHTHTHTHTHTLSLSLSLSLT
ncbi:hypothetical protein BLNAU_23057 [Blattamonas nauphoetae]|uniref:Uncharacterized protein n=1 Tax=Blattamonas nauphoetae TaxID=2049346 RepID=A0ABQ9WRR7_9EUKA|nr:hypothetical protein BLNAU_23057 [Blattamonas nauphoetae]